MHLSVVETFLLQSKPFMAIGNPISENSLTSYLLWFPSEGKGLKFNHGICRNNRA